MTDPTFDITAVRRRLELADRLCVAAIVCSVLYTTGRIMLFMLGGL